MPHIQDGVEKISHRIEGSFKNARASDTRCFSPPLNCEILSEFFIRWIKSNKFKHVIDFTITYSC